MIGADNLILVDNPCAMAQLLSKNFEDNYFTDHTNALKLGFFASAGADFMVTPKYAISLKEGYAKVYGIYSVENLQMCNLSLGFKI